LNESSDTRSPLNVYRVTEQLCTRQFSSAALISGACNIVCTLIATGPPEVITAIVFPRPAFDMTSRSAVLTLPLNVCQETGTSTSP
jgi:hypothetical protein